MRLFILDKVRDTYYNIDIEVEPNFNIVITHDCASENCETKKRIKTVSEEVSPNRYRMNMATLYYNEITNNPINSESLRVIQDKHDKAFDEYVSKRVPENFKIQEREQQREQQQHQLRKQLDRDIQERDIREREEREKSIGVEMRKRFGLTHR